MCVCVCVCVCMCVCDKMLNSAKKNRNNVSLQLQTQ